MRVLTVGIALVSVVAILSGCGLGPGAGTSNVSVTVTRGFGAHPIASVTRAQVPGSETVMRMLERSFHVQTRVRRRLRRVDRRPSRRAPIARDWFYYVNGIQAAAGRGRRRRSTAATGSGGTCTTGRATDSSPGRRRLVPRAVRRTASAASGCRRRSSARRDVGAACNASRPSADSRPACPSPASCLGAGSAGPTRCGASSAPGASSRG